MGRRGEGVRRAWRRSGSRRRRNCPPSVAMRYSTLRSSPRERERGCPEGRGRKCDILRRRRQKPQTEAAPERIKRCHSEADGTKRLLVLIQDISSAGGLSEQTASAERRASPPGQPSGDAVRRTTSSRFWPNNHLSLLLFSIGASPTVKGL